MKIFTHNDGTPKIEQPQKIVVRMPNWLGDCIMSTVFLSELLSAFNAITIDLILKPALHDLPLPHRGTVLIFDKHKTSLNAFAKELKRRDYSHMFILPPSLSSAWMAWRSAIPWRIGFKANARGALLNPALNLNVGHLVDEYCQLLSAVDIAPKIGGEVFLENVHSPIDCNLPSEYVVIAAGAEYGAAKRWPSYAQLAKRLVKEGHNIVFCGLNGDLPIGLGRHPHYYNLCGQTTLPQLSGVLAKAKAVISNDSGIMHMANALKVPQVALFGPTSPDWVKPRGGKAQILYRAESCSPCYRRECPLGHQRCLKEITIESVAQALHEVLNRSNN